MLVVHYGVSPARVLRLALLSDAKLYRFNIKIFEKKLKKRNCGIMSALCEGATIEGNIMTEKQK